MIPSPDVGQFVNQEAANPSGPVAIGKAPWPNEAQRPQTPDERRCHTIRDCDRRSPHLQRSRNSFDFVL